MEDFLLLEIEYFIEAFESKPEIEIDKTIKEHFPLQVLVLKGYLDGFEVFLGLSEGLLLIDKEFRMFFYFVLRLKHPLFLKDYQEILQWNQLLS